MSTHDGRFHIVFNGEIYNFLELRDELSALGHRFTSRSDTEVLLTALAQWGRDVLPRLVGMFAFALLDVKQGTVLLARDFFGIKPLYYSVEDGLVRFGSEIKALFALGLADRKADAQRLLCFLRYGMTDFGAETMFASVRQLPPAHCMEISIETALTGDPVCFWQPESGPELELSFDEAAKELKQRFLRNVELHLRSDVPLGTALSGGIDSSSIVCAIRLLDKNAEIHAFSYISEEEKTSEEVWVDMAGNAAGAHIHKIAAQSHELLDNITTLTCLHDEPVSRSSAHAQYKVFRAAREAGVKVLLDGQGADEILAGYRHYLGARLASLLRHGDWSDAVRLLRGISKIQGIGWMQTATFCADYLLPVEQQALPRKLAGKEAFPAWLNRRWFAERGAESLVSNHTREKDVLKDSLARDRAEGLPALLRYEDRNSMASSVESRVPFLTPDLVNFLGRLPESYLISPVGTSKSVFREAMRGIVPDPILDRRDKIGYATPEKLWLTDLDHWVQTTLNNDTARRLAFFDLRHAREEWCAIRGGKKPFDFRIWRWLSLIRWAELFQVTFDC
jgi:asparagine synthase (glutamine-hydrolysing)